MSSIGLKNCPFCGGEGELYSPAEELCVISCTQCNAESGYYMGEDSTTPDDAIKLWNTRTPCPELTAALAEIQSLKRSRARQSKRFDKMMKEKNGG